jgi:hypothetical protein
LLYCSNSFTESANTDLHTAIHTCCRMYIFVHKKGKAIPKTGVEAHRFLRRRGSHIFWTIGSLMAVRLSSLRAYHSLPAWRFLILISVRRCVDPRAVVRLQGLGQLKSPTTSSGI